MLSHELRTPLNAVYGWSKMLQGGELDDPAIVKRAVDAIVRNADVQVQLIDDLLDLSRISAGKMRLDIRPLELDKVLQAALDAVRPAADAKGIYLETDLDPDAGPVTRRPRPAPADRLEPADERREVHAQGRPWSGSGSTRANSQRQDRRERHRPGDRARRCWTTSSSASARRTARALARTAGSASASPW